MLVGDRKRPPLSPREGWLSDGRQVAALQATALRPLESEPGGDLRGGDDRRGAAAAQKAQLFSDPCGSWGREDYVIK